MNEEALHVIGDSVSISCRWHPILPHVVFAWVSRYREASRTLGTVSQKKKKRPAEVSFNTAASQTLVTREWPNNSVIWPISAWVMKHAHQWTGTLLKVAANVQEQRNVQHQTRLMGFLSDPLGMKQSPFSHVKGSVLVEGDPWFWVQSSTLLLIVILCLVLAEWDMVMINAFIRRALSCLNHRLLWESIRVCGLP